METRIKTVEEGPSRIVIRERFMPRRWGGIPLPMMLFFPILWLFLRITFGKTSIFDKETQSIVVEKRTFFVHRKEQTYFSDIDSLNIAPREIRDVPQGNPYAGVIITNVEDLSLLYHDGTRARIATTRSGSKELETLGTRLAYLIDKPFLNQT